MKNVFLVALLGGIMVLFSGCASIIKGGGDESFTFKSDPTSAQVTILDLKDADKTIVQNHTPFSIALHKKHAFFSGGKYWVQVTKPGYKDIGFEIKGTVNGWYTGGNLIFGGLLGYLIVDPATGAMWNLTPQLAKDEKQIEASEGVITIKLLSDLSNEDQAKVRAMKPMEYK